MAKGKAAAIKKKDATRDKNLGIKENSPRDLKIDIVAMKKPSAAAKGGKMNMKQYEKSATDKKIDKKMGYTENSKADKTADKNNLAAMNKKKK